jgi:hypothetical protein
MCYDDDYENGRDFDGGIATMDTTPKYPEIQVRLCGEDGNAFSIIGRCIKAMRAAGLPAGPIAAFQVEATSGDYDNVRQTAMRWFDVT